jgi:hypothetical protein
MNIRKAMYKSFLSAFICLILFVSCNDTTNCPVTYKYLNSDNIAINLDSSALTFFSNKITFSKLNYITKKITDTIFHPSDSTYTYNTRTVLDSVSALLAVKNDSTNYSAGVTIRLNDSASAGIKEPGIYYSNIKIICDSINIQMKTAYLRIFNSKFLQDCTDWK